MPNTNAPDDDVEAGHNTDRGEDKGQQDRQDFQRYAQVFEEHATAEVLGWAKTAFEKMEDFQNASGGGVYAPFKDREEWELAEWLIRNVNQRATEEFLKLSIVSMSQALQA